jgi:hypothetical protein
MATQVLGEINLETARPFMLRDIIPGAGWAPYQAPVRPLEREAEYHSDTDEAGGSCIRGLVMAFCLEAVTGVGAYAAWHAFHLLR